LGLSFVLMTFKGKDDTDTTTRRRNNVRV